MGAFSLIVVINLLNRLFLTCFLSKMSGMRVLKRALRLAKNWNAVVASDTHLERNHIRRLIDEEYFKLKEGNSKICEEYLKAMNSRLDMIEHYRTPFERPTHYAQHATIVDFHSMKKQKKISTQAKLPSSKQNVILNTPKKIK